MRIAIIALGTRGDVQPYIALGKGLQAAGHTVRLLTHDNFAGLVQAHGLEFWSVKGDVQAVAESPEMRALLEKGNFLAITARTAKEAKRAALQWAQDGLVACQGVELIVAGIGGLYIGMALAEKFAIPFVQAPVVPFTPTAAFPGALLPESPPRLGGLFNRISHQLTRQMMWQGFRGADRQMRQAVLGLPSAPFWGPETTHQGHKRLVLYGFSPSVLPKPADWGEAIQVTGYWFLPAATDWTPPPALVDFLQAGPTPVYIGFGSMVSRQPEATANLVVEALAKTKQRAILLTGWGGLRQEQLPETVFMVESIPHDWLFARVAAVVHHGGAGTTAAGIRAGVPSLVIPFFGDQFFWGQRVATLGVGPAPIPRKQLTVERLAAALQTMTTDQAMQQRAAQLGAQVQAEDGVARAVALIAAMIQ